jgi:hypothetical protein
MGAYEYRGAPESSAAPAGLFDLGWAWFSIPLTPQTSADASLVLSVDCTNRLFGWEEEARVLQLYPDDFTDLVVGYSYMIQLAMSTPGGPVYQGVQPDRGFERALRRGWAWVGVPGVQEIAAEDLSVRRGETIRTPAMDYRAADPWLNWNWVYWDPAARAPGVMNPFGSWDDAWLHPWYGYRVWANTEGVTIVFP